MALVKSKRRRTPMMSNVFMNDPFFSDFFNRGLMKNFTDSSRDFELNPAVNIRENKKEFEVELAAPGLNKDDFKVTLENGILTVSAEKEDRKEEEKEGFITREFSYNSFSKSIGMPDSVDDEKDISAKYSEGVLKLKLQKKKGMETKKPKTIKDS